MMSKRFLSCKNTKIIKRRVRQKIRLNMYVMFDKGRKCHMNFSKDKGI